MSDPAAAKQWSDPALLRSIRNPAPQLDYVTTIRNREVTFLGAPNQPDFAVVVIEYVAGARVIELKSLKTYFQWFRDKLISYERFISVVYEDLVATYEPKRLVITTSFNPRGGMRSKLVAKFPNCEGTP